MQSVIGAIGELNPGYIHHKMLRYTKGFGTTTSKGHDTKIHIEDNSIRLPRSRPRQCDKRKSFERGNTTRREKQRQSDFPTIYITRPLYFGK